MVSRRALGAFGTAASFAVASGVFPTTARADDHSTAVARDLAVQGRAAFSSGDYARADELFHRAYAIVAAPTISLYEARCLVRLGRLTEAAALYRRTVATPVDPKAPEQFHKAAADASQELAALAPRLATVTVVLVGSRSDAAPSIVLDGATADGASLGAETPLDPGAHRVDVTVGGEPTKSVSFTLAEGEHRRVPVMLAPAPAEQNPRAASKKPEPAPGVESGGPSRPLRTWAFMSFGVGVAAIGTGVVTGLMAAGKHSEAQNACPRNQCVEGSPGAGDVQAFHGLTVASTIGYAVGAAAVAGGVTLLLVGPPHEKAHASNELELVIGPERASVRGIF
jgi:hypothetical protein